MKVFYFVFWLLAAMTALFYSFAGWYDFVNQNWGWFAFDIFASVISVSAVVYCYGKWEEA